MNVRSIMFRWIPTLLAFPIGGQFVVWTLGGVDTFVESSIAGMIVGITVGFFQFHALKTIAITPRWIWASMLGMTIGSMMSYLIEGTSTDITALVLKGFLSGFVVGFAQIISQRKLVHQIVLWSVLTSVAWAIGWFITANVIVDAASNYAIFGSSGALVATILLSFVINVCLLDKANIPGGNHV